MGAGRRAGRGGVGAAARRQLSGGRSARSRCKDRLEALVATSGSSVRNDLVSILYYRMRFWRLSPVFALIPGTWQDAVPRPYAEWQDALERWEAPAGG